MRLSHVLPVAVLLTTLLACNDERRQTAAREVGEEVDAVVEAIGPESAVPPTPPPPTQLITVEETLAAVTGAGDLTAIGATAALPVIDKWIGTLAGNLDVDDTDLLVEDLSRLRAELAGGSPDPERLEDILERLARETRQAGEDADDEGVVELAGWLERAAEAMD